VRDPAAVLSVDLGRPYFAQTTLDTLWVGAATYIPTAEGWLYLATVIDACSRQLLGWSMTDHRRTELCLDALHAAVGTRGGPAYIGGVIFHSDHGCQYSADAYRDACSALGVIQSMGTVGDSYNNAMAESFFASLKRELVDDEHFATRAEARAAVFEWLIWYNNDRLHSALQYRPTVEYEQHLPTTNNKQHKCPLGGGKFTSPDEQADGSDGPQACHTPFPSRMAHRLDAGPESRCPLARVLSMRSLDRRTRISGVAQPWRPHWSWALSVR
jgi:hypothetical protein